MKQCSKRLFSLRGGQQGVTLIEVLVAVLITATGVLGAAALQLNSVKFNQSASTRSSAVFLANDIADRLRSNRGLALIGSYDLTMDAGIPKGDTINLIDQREWLTELSLRLPSGDGSIARNGSTFTITIQWNEARLSETREAGASDNEAFVFVTEL
jgi:type IV pilus assembly protein PilV